MSLRRREVRSEIEEKILTGLIVSDIFCRDISKLIGKETFLVPFIARVANWCKSYYDKYKKAPKNQITDIYNAEKETLDESDSQAISTMLTKLSEEYEENGFNDEYLNVDYLEDRAIEYIKKRIIQTTAEKSLSLIELGRINEAEGIINSYKPASILTSGWENPFDPDVIENFFADETSKRDQIFQLPGDIGRFIGPMMRNTLVGFLAPTKRGKTFWLLEMAIQATLCGKRVLFASLEMNSHRVKQRFYKRLIAMSSESKEYIFPCFDCAKNQDDSCGKEIRTNFTGLLIAGEKPKYDKEMDYRPCTACRGKGDGFVPATWFVTEKREKTKPAHAIKKIKGIGNQFGSGLKMISYPAFSANLQRLRHDIEILNDREGFLPDVIVIDYADILGPEDARIIGRDRIDETWKTLKRMSDEIHCCTISASQSNRQSFTKKNVIQTDAAEDIRKIANSDLFLAINQTPEEKREGCVRLSRIAARDEDFDQYASVIVLQQLSLGQVIVDSCTDNLMFAEMDYEEDFMMGI